MTRLDPTTTTALTHLDPAPAELDAAQLTREHATLTTILASSRHDNDARFVPVPSTRRRTIGRAVALGGVAAAATTGIVAAQVIGGSESAYAGWTATPKKPTAQQQAAAAAKCRQDNVESAEAGARYRAASEEAAGSSEIPLRDQLTWINKSQVALAEQRGPWSLVVLSGTGFEAICLDGGPDADEDSEAGGARTYSGEAEPLDPRRIEVAGGGISDGPGGENIVHEYGRVGSDVERITIRTTNRGDVIATVANGYFAAWWPVGDIPDVEAVRLVDTAEAVITYTDGTQRVKSLDSRTVNTP
ncbi:MAG: hypothetical protein ACRCY8_14095 [Dermatophilaceae bacterium]